VSGQDRTCEAEISLECHYSDIACLENYLAETSIAYMVADSFAVLALACYILICLDVLKGLVPLACAEAPQISPHMASYSTVPMPVAAAAAAETTQSEPASLPAGPFRTKSIERMMLNTRDTPMAPNSPRMLIRFTPVAPAKPRQITSTKEIKEPDLLLLKVSPNKPPAERALGCSAPGLDAATLPAVQATALDLMVANTRTETRETSRSEPASLPAGPFRTKSIEQPKTPNSPRMPICFTRHYYKSFTSAAPAKPRQITSTKGIKEPDLLLPKKPPAKRALGRSAPALLESSLTPSEGSDHDCRMLGLAGFRHPASAIPQGTGSKDSRRGSSLGIKASRGPSVSSSSKFYANVVRLAVRAHLLH
jgi:hypothetical protein